MQYAVAIVNIVLNSAYAVTLKCVGSSPRLTIVLNSGTTDSLNRQLIMCAIGTNV